LGKVSDKRYTQNQNTVFMFRRAPPHPHPPKFASYKTVWKNKVDSDKAQNKRVRRREDAVFMQDKTRIQVK